MISNIQKLTISFNKICNETESIISQIFQNVDLLTAPSSKPHQSIKNNRYPTNHTFELERNWRLLKQRDPRETRTAKYLNWELYNSRFKRSKFRANKIHKQLIQPVRIPQLIRRDETGIRFSPLTCLSRLYRSMIYYLKTFHDVVGCFERILIIYSCDVCNVLD